MAVHEEKNCPRCGGLFECKSGSIGQCDCASIQLSVEITERIRQEFNECLCLTCLKELSVASNSPGENTLTAEI